MENKTLGAGNDTFDSLNSATSQTLNAGDVLVGGDGTDRLAIVSSIAGGTLGAGVQTTSVEQLSVNAVGATTVEAATMAGVTDVYNNASLSAVTVNALNALANVHVLNTNQDTTVAFAAAAVAGVADATTVLLNGSATNTRSNTVIVNGIETINLVAAGTASGSATTNTTVTSDALTTLNITGVGAAVSAGLPGATATVTGTVTSDAGAHDVTITGVVAADKLSVSMNAGNDTVRISTIAATHTINGGDGTDTLVADTAISATTGANISGIEAVSTGVAGTVALPTGNLINAVTFTGTGSTVSTVLSGATVSQAATGTNTVSNTAWTTGTADSLTVNVGATGTAAGSTGIITQNLTANGIETATINNLQLGSDTSARTVGVTGANLATLTVNSAGTAPITISSTAGGVLLKTINAAGVGGTTAFTASATNTLPAGFSLTTGTGGDIVGGFTGNDTLDGGAGNDTITGGVGIDVLTGGAGTDRFVFAANATGAVVSSAFAIDTIKDFVSGTDKLAITNITAGPTKFLGNFTNYSLANASALADTTAGVAFFVSGENTLYVQAVAGTQGANDFAAKLEGVTSIAEADLLLGSVGGSAITLSALAQSVTATSTTPGATTSFNDTITGTIANVVGATTLVGGTGTDSVVLSDAGTFAAPTLFNSIETLVLANGTNTITINNGATNHALANITGGTGADGVTVTNIVPGGTISLGDGGDSLAAMTTAIATAITASFDGGANAGGAVDTVTFAGGQTFAATNLDKFSNFESFDFGAVANANHAITLPTTNSITTVAATFGTATNVLSITGTSAQIDAITSTTQAGNFAGGITYIVSNAANITIAATDTLASSATASANVSYTLGNFTNVVNIDASKLGDANTDTTKTGVIAGGTGTDTLNISGTNSTTTTNLDFITGFENINITGTGSYSATPVVGALVTGTTNISASAVIGTTTITIDATAGTSAKKVNITGGALTTSSNVLTGGAGADTLTGGAGADTLAGGTGADVLNLGGGAVGVITATATSTGVAAPLAISSAIPTVGTVISTLSLDIVNGFAAGNTIAITTAANSTTVTTYNLIRNGGTLGAGTVNNAALITGNYDSATNLFTVSNTGTSTLFAYDDDGILNVSNNFVGIVLVGYTDTGAADTYIAGGTTGATFTSVG